MLLGFIVEDIVDRRFLKEVYQLDGSILVSDVYGPIGWVELRRDSRSRQEIGSEHFARPILPDNGRGISRT
jgi:hypothetical protein